ncbi:hypothetical protein RSOLAG1IB_10235 [Rhizoctonia solani AG-1 IB]|uniref:Uncharacterized protein n=1 Tax=Thanatephorus cucumeris (strain AG1-IB / isolate 7/3/14) TaxID=1108050 RepID=A0A0B7FW25_THACB|nr:hypothetical protein RSOLAG1IB_10235 [Rhizoctonia solani AG-1 IB]
MLYEYYPFPLTLRFIQSIYVDGENNHARGQLEGYHRCLKGQDIRDRRRYSQSAALALPRETVGKGTNIS